jgi:propanol-preferring alcohol dehydrogenase
MHIVKQMMFAAQFVAVGRPLAIREVPMPQAGHGEVLVAVRAVGLCGSDLHIQEGHTPVASTPLTLGHEIAGTIAAVGKGVMGVDVGGRVFVNPMLGCGDCTSCAYEDASSCTRRRTLGIHLDGGLAEFVVVPAANAIPLPESIPFAQIAIIESAGTANRAIRTVDARPGGSMLVVGAGGIGMQVVRLAVASGVRVTAIDRDPVALERSRAAGAREVFTPEDFAQRQENREYDTAVDCVGFPRTVLTALEALAPLGRLAIVGIGDVAPSLTVPAHFVRRGLTVSGIYGYAQRDIAQVIGRVVDGSLDLAPSVSATVALEDINAGLSMFRDRQASPTRVVVEL